MKRVLPLLTIVAVVTVTLTGFSGSTAAAPSAQTAQTAQTDVAVIATRAPVDAAGTATAVISAVPMTVGAEPAAPPAHAAPRVAAVTTVAPVKSSSSGSSFDSSSGNSSAAHTAYINAMYRSVVPARQRAALAGRYVLGYDLPGLGCGTGCTGLFDGQARSSFNAAFIAQSVSLQRNTIAHEAAHAYGFLYISGYTVPSWAGMAGWQAQFHAADRGFVRTYDAEAWASCVAWRESGNNNRPDQITHACTSSAAALAMAQII
jgi:hypothetical protein